MTQVQSTFLRNDIYAIRYDLLWYIDNLYPRQKHFVSSQETLALFLKIFTSVNLATTHLMPRRAPLRADSLPVLSCCSRWKRTLRRHPSAIYYQSLRTIASAQGTLLAFSALQTAIIWRSRHDSAQTESPVNTSRSRARQGAAFGRNL